MAGGVSGALGKVAGVLAKTTTKLTFDEQYQEERRRSSGSKGIGQGLEGAAKVVPCTSNKHSPCQLLSVDTCMAVIYRIQNNTSVHGSDTHGSITDWFAVLCYCNLCKQ